MMKTRYWILAGTVGLLLATGRSVPAQFYVFGTLARNPSIVGTAVNPERFTWTARTAAPC